MKISIFDHCNLFEICVLKFEKLKQTVQPTAELFVIFIVYYMNNISKQTTTAKNATPSISAAETIILDLISLAASG